MRRSACHSPDTGVAQMPQLRARSPNVRHSTVEPRPTFFPVPPPRCPARHLTGGTDREAAGHLVELAHGRVAHACMQSAFPGLRRRASPADRQVAVLLAHDFGPEVTLIKDPTAGLGAEPKFHLQAQHVVEFLGEWSMRDVVLL